MPESGAVDKFGAQKVNNNGRRLLDVHKDTGTLMYEGVEKKITYVKKMCEWDEKKMRWKRYKRDENLNVINFIYYALGRKNMLW